MVYDLCRNKASPSACACPAMGCMTPGSNYRKPSPDDAPPLSSHPCMGMQSAPDYSGPEHPDVQELTGAGAGTALSS